MYPNAEPAILRFSNQCTYLRDRSKARNSAPPSPSLPSLVDGVFETLSDNILSLELQSESEEIDLFSHTLARGYDRVATVRETMIVWNCSMS